MNRTVPLYKVVYNSIRERIECGELSSGDRGPSEADLVSEFSVSRITAIRALNDLADDGYIRRVPKVGTIVLEPAEWYRDKQQSPGLKTIPLVIPITSDDVPHLMAALQQVAQENGFFVSPLDSGQDLAKERELLIKLADMPVDGVICFPIGGYDNLPYYESIRRAGKPVVTVDKRLPVLDVPCVTTHNTQSAYNLTRWLVEQKGHTRIAFCCASLYANNERYRYHGYLKALMDCGIDPDPDYAGEMLRPEQLPLLTQDEGVKQNVRAYLKRLLSLPKPPTALVCAFDMLAFLVEQQAQHLKIRIPEDLSVTGFDNLSLCEIMSTPLTTMAQDFSAIGRTAFDNLLQLMRGKSVEPLTLYESSLVERKSVLDLTKTGGS